MGRKYKVAQNPNWRIEAIGFVLEAMKNRLEMAITNAEAFGKKREELESFFKPYTVLKEKLKTEIMPIYEKYPILYKIFQMESKLEKEELDLGIILIIDIEQRYKGQLTDENVDRLIENYIQEKINSIEAADKKIEINSLSSLVSLLEPIDMPDKEKMFYISLYLNRYEFIREMLEFSKEAEPILKENFYLIQDEYNKSVTEFNKYESIESLIEKMITLRLNIEAERKVVYTIFPFSSINIRHHNGEMFITIGIYMHYFKKWMDEKGFQGAELVSSLKALADPTRLSILNKISIRPMYIQELAEELNLTSATISHHINILLRAQLVNIIVESDSAKKIYYEINRDKLIEIARTIEHLGDERTRGFDFNGKTASISIS